MAERSNISFLLAFREQPQVDVVTRSISSRSHRVVTLLLILLIMGCAAVPKPSVPAVSGSPIPEIRVAIYIPREMQSATLVWRIRYLSWHDPVPLGIAIGQPFVKTLIESVRHRFPTLDVHRKPPLTGTYDLLFEPTLNAELHRQHHGGKLELNLKVAAQLFVKDANGKQLAALSEESVGTASMEAVTFPQQRASGYTLSQTAGSIGGPAYSIKVNRTALETYIHTYLDDLGKSAGQYALDQVLRGFAYGLGESGPLQDYVAHMQEQRTQPSELVASVMFDDREALLPNHMLDAGETAAVIVTVSNQGTGTGYGVTLAVSADQPHITLTRSHELSDILPGRDRELRLPVTGGLTLPSGEASFLIDVREKRGYHARRVKLVVPTARLEKPSLAVVSHEINDGTTGQAQGNGNGIAENGETIELLVFVRNDGPGPAAGATLSVAVADPGIAIIRPEAALGVIPPHQTARGTVALAVRRTYSRNDLHMALQVRDGRGEAVGSLTYPVALHIGSRAPVLAAVTRVLDEGRELQKVTNNQTVELEVTPRNTGTMNAEDVVVQIQADQPGVMIPQDKATIGTLPAGTAGASQRFAVTVPRAFTDERLSLAVTLTQRGFPAQVTRLDLPVQVLRPVLVSTFTVAGRRGGLAIEQNETADLDVRIVNTGNLPAQDVQAQLKTAVPGVAILGAQTVTIGTIAPQAQGLARFRLQVQRSVPPGELPLSLTITQADFPLLDQTLRAEVRPEQALVQRVEAAPRTRSVLVRPQPPSILPVSPRDGQFVRDAQITLAGTVVDDRGIERVTVAVNGKPVPQETVLQGLHRQPARPGSTRDQATLTVPIPLELGHNIITVTAYNAANEREQVSLSVTRLEAEPRPGKAAASLVPHADVDTYILGRKATHADPGRWAVIIGIEQYRKVPSVDFAVRDAYAMRDYAVKLLGVPPDQVFLLLDDQATKSEMQVLLEDRLRRRIPPGSTIFIYFAGHGIPDVQNGTPYLLPADGDPQSLRFSAYAVDALYAALGKLKADRVAVFLDTCFSGLSARQDRPQSLFPGARPATLVVRDPVLASPNLVSLAAARNDQVSNAYPAQAHGLFTYFLLKGLSGAADSDRDRTVRLTELARYLQAEVDRTTRRLFGATRAQTPVIQPEAVSSRDFVLRMQEN